MTDNPLKGLKPNVWPIAQFAQDERNHRMTHFDDRLIGRVIEDLGDGREHTGFFTPLTRQESESLLDLFNLI